MSTLSEQGRQGPGRREQQRVETRREILSAASALFAELGFERTTTKLIAERAGVAQGTVFLVAPTKEALLVEVFDERLRAAAKERLASLPKKGIERQLGAFFDGMFALYAEKPALSRVLLKGILFFADPSSKAHYDAHVSALSQVLEGLFQAAEARGELAPKTDAKVAAASVVALYLTSLVTVLNGDEPSEIALGKRFRAMLAQLFRGIGAKGPR